MISPVEAMIDYIIKEHLEKTIVKSADSNWAKGLINGNMRAPLSSMGFGGGT